MILESVFLIRSYGAPNGARECPMAQCYDRFGTQWCNSKIIRANRANAALDLGTKTQ